MIGEACIRGLTFGELIFGGKNYIGDFKVFHKEFLFGVLDILDLLYFTIIISNDLKPSSRNNPSPNCQS